MRFSAQTCQSSERSFDPRTVPLRESSSAAGERSRRVLLDDPGLALEEARRGVGSIRVISECDSDGGVSWSGDGAFGREGSDLSSSMVPPFEDALGRREGFLADFFRRLSINDS